MLHAPSLGIGAGIAAVVIIGVFFVLNMPITDQGFKVNDIKEVQPEPQDATPQQVQMTVFSENGSPILGDVNAPITIVEFGDYQCFYCNKFFHETEDQINENYIKTGKAKLIFKDFTIIGADSIVSAHAAHCANEQGKFWEYHDTLYKNWNGENNGWASADNQFRFAKEVGLDENAFTECMSSEKYKLTIQASSNDAKTLGLTGTPAFFIIGPNNKIVKIPGAQPYDVFVNILDSNDLKK
ncbi:MAG: DsbA family protein [Nitrososphaeria archaeon]|nr:DsbA family protein [Nitrosopumilaceae archaeon]NDB89611.1 DsbA family protein [Nitrososphaerota archaeon]NDF29634.1 DsbA family protein [Nitrososphaeria archaeon]NDF24790.1 DsbA family protein [Nitrososphaerota archaeon]NDF27032.1 DsbA family protein [Nitrosopumilaceae archaeon]